jgi:hypothetical protein
MTPAYEALNKALEDEIRQTLEPDLLALYVAGVARTTDLLLLQVLRSLRGK